MFDRSMQAAADLVLAINEDLEALKAKTEAMPILTDELLLAFRMQTQLAVLMDLLVERLYYLASLASGESFESAYLEELLVLLSDSPN